MISEEKFNQEVWWVLQEITHLKNLARERENIIFLIEIRPINSSDKPLPDVQESILLKLEEWKAIKIIKQEVEDVIYGKNAIYTIEVLEAEFKKVYHKYRNLVLDDYQRQLFRISKQKLDNIIGSEKQRVKNINIANDHRLIRDQWLNIKRILDGISKQLSPLSETEQRIYINPDNLPPEQKTQFEHVLKNLLEVGVASYDTEPLTVHFDGGKITQPKLRSTAVVITSAPFRHYLKGHVIINNRLDFEKYREIISSLNDIIEEDGKKRFAGAYGGYKSIEEIKKDALMTALKEMPSKPNKGMETPPPTKLKDTLNFWEDSGDIEYKNETGEIRGGTKGFALLKILHGQKNTPFSIEHIKNECNPLINKSEHYFRTEKDIQDIIRAIKFKVKVTKKSYFPIIKKGGKDNYSWIWIEK